MTTTIREARCERVHMPPLVRPRIVHRDDSPLLARMLARTSDTMKPIPSRPSVRPQFPLRAAWHAVHRQRRIIARQSLANTVASHLVQTRDAVATASPNNTTHLVATCHDVPIGGDIHWRQPISFAGVCQSCIATSYGIAIARRFAMAENNKPIVDQYRKPIAMAHVETATIIRPVCSLMIVGRCREKYWLNHKQSKLVPLPILDSVFSWEHKINLNRIPAFTTATITMPTRQQQSKKSPPWKSELNDWLQWRWSGTMSALPDDTTLNAAYADCGLFERSKRRGWLLSDEAQKRSTIKLREYCAFSDDILRANATLLDPQSLYQIALCAVGKGSVTGSGQIGGERIQFPNDWRVLATSNGWSDTYAREVAKRLETDGVIALPRVARGRPRKA